MLVYERIRDKKEKIAVVGLGYVGLPLAAAFSKKANVIGFDVNERKIRLYKSGIDPTREVGDDNISRVEIDFTSDESRLREALFIIIAVPTPINGDKTPDLSPLINASQIVGKYLRPGALVVYESTVYPGVTETECVPILEAASGMTCGKDFKVGYSPERINPGDKVHRLENIVKVVSAVDDESMEDAAALYGMIISAGIHRAASIKVAEACKVAENSQRDINIAFMNELAMAFDIMGVDTGDVIEAMNTKWNALPFRPGLVGGHCIGVDPYYFIYEAKKRGYRSKLITPGRQINDSMSGFIVNKIINMLIHTDRIVRKARICIFGIAFKENCCDIRNSKVMDIIKLLQSYGIQPQVVDPCVDADEAKESYGVDLSPMESVGPLDCMVFTVAHDGFTALSEEQLGRMFAPSNKADENIIIDVKGIFSNSGINEKGYKYWRL